MCASPVWVFQLSCMHSGCFGSLYVCPALSDYLVQGNITFASDQSMIPPPSPIVPLSLSRACFTGNQKQSTGESGQQVHPWTSQEVADVGVAARCLTLCKWNITRPGESWVGTSGLRKKGDVFSCSACQSQVDSTARGWWEWPATAEEHHPHVITWQTVRPLERKRAEQQQKWLHVSVNLLHESCLLYWKVSFFFLYSAPKVKKWNLKAPAVGKIMQQPVIPSF